MCHNLGSQRILITNTKVLTENFDGGADKVVGDLILIDLTHQELSVHVHFSVFPATWKSVYEYIAKHYVLVDDGIVA